MNVEDFGKNGWAVLDFEKTEIIYQIREKLEKKLAELLGKKIPLEDYRIEEDKEHTDIQIKMTEFYRKQRMGPSIIASQCKLFKEFLGPDLFVQKNPYLRITRPAKPQDNIGYHRDTFYGGSPYELSVLVTFVDLPKESSLKVLTGSHTHSEDLYPVSQIDGGITKGSDKHQLGFLYSPKLMNEKIEAQMQAIPLKIGQALIFSLSTVHGSRVNDGISTRWSSDIRVMNALAPVDLTLRPDYYSALSFSEVTKSAQKYLRENGKQTGNDVELELCHTAS